VRFNHPYDARHPQVTMISYRIDQDAKRAWRVSATPDRPAWAEAVLKTGGAAIGKVKGRGGKFDQDGAPAPYVETPGPEITMAKEADGRLRLHVAPPEGARVVDLVLTVDTAATITEVGGVPVHRPMKSGGDMIVRWAAAQPGYEVVIAPGGPGKLTVLYSVLEERWPPGVPPLPPRPKDVAPFDVSDSMAIEGTRRFSW